MGLFDYDDYEEIYDDYDDDDDDIDYSELDENDDPDEVIERVKADGITSGDCIYCYGKNTMKYDGCICFICTKCGMSVHEDIYYRWAAGYSIK